DDQAMKVDARTRQTLAKRQRAQAIEISLDLVLNRFLHARLTCRSRQLTPQVRSRTPVPAEPAEADLFGGLSDRRLTTRGSGPGVEWSTADAASVMQPAARPSNPAAERRMDHARYWHR